MAISPYDQETRQRAVRLYFEELADGASSKAAALRAVEAVIGIKGVSSRRMRQEFPELVQHYWRAQRLWSGSYFAGSVGGAPLSILRQYIEQQDRPV